MKIIDFLSVALLRAAFPFSFAMKLNDFQCVVGAPGAEGASVDFATKIIDLRSVVWLRAALSFRFAVKIMDFPCVVGGIPQVHAAHPRLHSVISPGAPGPRPPAPPWAGYAL